MEWETHIMEMQPTNLEQQWCDAIMLIWTNIAGMFAAPCSFLFRWRIKAKGVQPSNSTNKVTSDFMDKRPINNVQKNPPPECGFFELSFHDIERDAVEAQ